MRMRMPEQKPEDTRYIKKITLKYDPKHREIRGKDLIPNFAIIRNCRLVNGQGCHECVIIMSVLFLMMLTCHVHTLYDEVMVFYIHKHIHEMQARSIRLNMSFTGVTYNQPCIHLHKSQYLHIITCTYSVETINRCNIHAYYCLAAYTVKKKTFGELQKLTKFHHIVNGRFLTNLPNRTL